MQFNWDWEYKNKDLLNSIPFVKKLIYMESLYFHPDPVEEVKEEESPAKKVVDNSAAKTPTAIKELLMTTTALKYDSPVKRGSAPVGEFSLGAKRVGGPSPCSSDASGGDHKR